MHEIAKREGCGFVATAEHDFFAGLELDDVANVTILFGTGNVRHRWFFLVPIFAGGACSYNEIPYKSLPSQHFRL